jgi:anti-anti-sigma factor
MQNPTAVPVEGTDIVRIVVGADRLDVYNAPALRALSVQLVSELKYRQILDLEGVRDADSTSLGVIVGAGKRATLVLANVGPGLAHTLRITGLDKTLIIASDVESAVAFFQPPQIEDDDEPEPSFEDRRRRLEADIEDARKTLNRAQSHFNKLCDEAAALRREEMEARRG